VNVKVSEEQELVAAGLHPKDIVWLERRVASLEAALLEIAAGDELDLPGVSLAIAESALSEGDASD